MIISGGESMGAEISIYTLGKFKVFRGNQNLTQNRKKSSKRWKLFQYLITYRNREVSREELIMGLELNTNQDPEASLTALVYRLRKILKTKEYKKDLIKTRGAAYTFNQNFDYWLDAECFQKLCRKSASEVEDDFEKGLKHFQKALDLYNGDYLEETDSAEWIWSVRNKYRELLITTLVELKKHTVKKDHYNRLWQFFNQVQHLKTFDERLIKGSIELLIKADRISEAKKQYDEVLSIYEDNDLILPPELKELKFELGEPGEAEPNNIFSQLKEKNNAEGAFICRDRELFNKFFKIEKRRIKRESEPRFLAHLRLTGDFVKEKIKRYGDKFIAILAEHLRSGDIVCRWNCKHFIILLINLEKKDADSILKRIKRVFYAKNELPAELSLEKRIYQL